MRSIVNPNIFRMNSRWITGRRQISETLNSAFIFIIFFTYFLYPVK